MLGRFIVAALDGLILQQLADPDDDRAASDLESIIDAAVALAAPRPGEAVSAVLAMTGKS